MCVRCTHTIYTLHMSIKTQLIWSIGIIIVSHGDGDAHSCHVSVTGIHSKFRFRKSELMIRAIKHETVKTWNISVVYAVPMETNDFGLWRNVFANIATLAISHFAATAGLPLCHLAIRNTNKSLQMCARMLCAVILVRCKTPLLSRCFYTKKSINTQLSVHLGRHFQLIFTICRK